ncbi:hypothetical protein A1D26_00605 [Ursidibacter maritimus]|nr:hypothetical protein A1D26_00605 [Ursidibacter maritimus]
MFFGLLKRQRKAFTGVVENTKTEMLLPVIKMKIKPIWVYTDTYRSYDALDVSEFRFNFGTPKEQLRIL